MVIDKDAVSLFCFFRFCSNANETRHTNFLRLNILRLRSFAAFTGREINFFFLGSKILQGGSQLKKLVAIFKDKQKLFLAVSVLDRPSKIKLGKRSLTCYKLDSMMDNIQRSSSPKSKMASSHRFRCMCCVLETDLTGKFAAALSF